MLTTKERFWTKVEFTPTCWIWHGGNKGKPGSYGRFHYEGTMKSAHRVAWLLTYGYWPNKDLMHSCDNPPCVRPGHLSEGTAVENNLDKMAKGRNWSKLTPAQIIEIHGARAGGATLKDIADRYGVSIPNVYYIVSGKSWRRMQPHNDTKC